MLSGSAVLATSGPTAMWYLTRATGAVAMILLTVSVVLGVVNVRRWRGERWPRFVLDALHRNVSLLVLVVIVVHVLTTVLDGFAPVTLVDGVIPFRTAYRSLWVGLGALSFDLLLAVAITSLVRARLGHRTWRAVHWLAYGSWPLALVHGLGSGTDVKAGWMVVLTGVCLLAVIWAIGVRLVTGWPEHEGARVAGFAALVIGPVLLLIWLPQGPLGHGWARRAGTPARLLAFTGQSSAGQPAAKQPSRSASTSATTPSLDGPFSASVIGSVSVGPTATAGVDEVDLELKLHGAGHRRVSIRIYGPPSAGGGVALSSSQVTLGTTERPAIYRGSVAALQGTQVAANLTRSDGHAVSLQAVLAISPDNRATGTVSIRPAGGSGR